MAKIFVLIPDAELAAIDEVASPNRTAFILEATRKAVAQIKGDRLDLEIAECLEETAADDVVLLDDFSATAADGL